MTYDADTIGLGLTLNLDNPTGVLLLSLTEGGARSLRSQNDSCQRGGGGLGIGAGGRSSIWVRRRPAFPAGVISVSSEKFETYAVHNWA